MSKAIRFRNRNNEPIYVCPYYPIGSIYLSVTNLDPGTIFGGKWEQIKDKFLLCCGSTYPAGSTGGSTSHYHGYRIGYYPYYGVLIGEDNRGIMAYDYATTTWKYGESDSGLPGSGTGNNAIVDKSVSKSSAKYSTYATTQATSNIPPYIAIYVWKRVS